MNPFERLMEGAVDQIDAAIWNGDLFHNQEHIDRFRDMMERWERGLQECESIVNRKEKR